LLKCDGGWVREMRFEKLLGTYKIDCYPKPRYIKYAKRCGLKIKIPIDYIVCVIISFIAPRFVSLDNGASVLVFRR
jgi:hypothetical protein